MPLTGDLVSIKVGDVIPADVSSPFLYRALSFVTNHRLSSQLRLVSVSNLEISEQLLTGESVPGMPDHTL